MDVRRGGVVRAASAGQLRLEVLVVADLAADALLEVHVVVSSDRAAHCGEKWAKRLFSELN